VVKVIEPWNKSPRETVSNLRPWRCSKHDWS